MRQPYPTRRALENTGRRKLSPAAVNTKPPPTAAELQRAAVAVQRAAIRKQAEDLGLWLMPLDGKNRRPKRPEPPDCDPLDDKVVNPLIEDAAKQQSLDPKLLHAMIGQESAFRPCAVSPKEPRIDAAHAETAAELGVADRSIPGRISMAAPASSSSSSTNTKAICRRLWAPITPDQRRLTNPAVCRTFKRPASTWMRS